MTGHKKTLGPSGTVAPWLLLWLPDESVMKGFPCLDSQVSRRLDLKQRYVELAAGAFWDPKVCGRLFYRRDYLSWLCILHKGAGDLRRGGSSRF